jgi:5-methylcytosine-specific restriction protein A
MSFHCDVCCTTLQTEKSYQNHLQTASHKARTDPHTRTYKCECGKSYSASKSLWLHRQTCTVSLEAKATSLPLEQQVDAMRDQIKAQDRKNEEMQNQINQLLDIASSKPVAAANCETQNNTVIEDVLSRISQLEKLKTRVSQIEMKLMRQDSKRCKIPDRIRLDICTKQNGQCKGCDQVLGDFFQLDHIVALRFGGTNDVTNLQALCGQCHNEKSALESIHQLEIQEAVSTILEKHKESRRLNMATS